MPRRAINEVISYLGGAPLPEGADLTDGQLLECFLSRRDAAALEALVRRHAPMVWGVCRRVLANHHDAEDAFQATFLVLVRKAASVSPRARVGNWLYGVAHQTALKARATRAKRKTRERPVTEMPEPAAVEQDVRDDLQPMLDEELSRLPEKYRAVIVLCDLEGRTGREAARQLGCPEGTVASRLARGRALLAKRLARHGLTVTGGALVGMLSREARAAVPASILTSTIRAVTVVPGKQAAATAAVSGTVAALAESVIKAMLLNRLLKALTALLLVAALSGAAALVAQTQAEDPPKPPPNVEPSQADRPQPRQDLHGDPLPPDALARMGSIRWRHVDDFPNHLAVVPSPTGRLVATFNRGDHENRMIRVWALADGRRLCEFPREDTPAGGDLKFTADGTRLLFVGPRGVVRFHDPQTGKVLAESKPVVEKDDVQPGGLASGPYSNTRHMLSEDGRWVVTSDEGKLTLTEVVTDPAAAPHRVRLDPPPIGSPGWRNSFCSDGNALVAVVWDKSTQWMPVALRWDVRTGRFLRATPLRIKSNGMPVASSRDGKRVVAWRYDVPPDDVLRVWDTETGAEAVALEGAARSGYGYIRFSPDGKRLAAATGRTETSMTAVVWELDRGKVVGRVTVPGWCEWFFPLPDGKTILAASSLGMMFGTWDLATGRRLSPTTGHESPMEHVAFTPDGKTLLTASTDPEERVTTWEAATGKKRRELAAPHGPPHNGMGPGPSAPFVWTPGGAIVTSGKGTLVWTDLQTGRELRRVTPRPIAAALAQVDFFQQEQLSLTHDPQTGRPAVLGLHSFGPSPDLSEGPEYRWKDVVTLWDAESGELLAHQTYTRDRYEWKLAVISPDGRWLARGSYDAAGEASVEVRPAFGGSGSVRLPHPDDRAPHCLFTPDGQTLITVTRKRTPEGKPAEPDTVRLWEVRSGRKRLEFTLPFARVVVGNASRSTPSTFAVSPDGRFLAVDLADERAIAVRDLAAGGEVARRSGYGPSVQTLAFRPDGKALASGHADGTALVWDLSGLPGLKPAAADREAAWNDLASADAGKAYRAILALAADPGCAAFLGDRVKPAPAVPAGQVRKLVEDLDDDRFATREAASAALVRLGDADAELRTLLRGKLSPEQHRRVEEVLAKRSWIESDPERLRALRCVEALERAASGHRASPGADAAPEADTAVALLKTVSTGAPQARLTQEAKSSLERLQSGY
jgi:RNA polymerase sigma factor (sigma-70 family)